jgi:hypothetical protein
VAVDSVEAAVAKVTNKMGVKLLDIYSYIHFVSCLLYLILYTPHI